MSKKLNKKTLKNIKGGLRFVELTDEMVCPKCNQTFKINDIIHLNGDDICPKCNQKINVADSYEAVFT